MTLTLSKWGLESPPRLLKVWNSIAGVKTPRLEVFFISLEKVLKESYKFAWDIITIGGLKKEL
jgi:hypothetical protein